MSGEFQLETIKAFTSCDICHKLLKNATCIGECAHKFCSECIRHHMDTNNDCPTCGVVVHPVKPKEHLKQDMKMQAILREILLTMNTKGTAAKIHESEYLRKELTCPICLHLFQKTMVSKSCLHRFCLDCIGKSLNVCNRECPLCRQKIISKRSLRADCDIDHIIALICPNGEYEAVPKNVKIVLRPHPNTKKNQGNRVRYLEAPECILVEDLRNHLNAKNNNKMDLYISDGTAEVFHKLMGPSRTKLADLLRNNKYMENQGYATLFYTFK